MSAALARPRRTSAAATAAAIRSSLREEANTGANDLREEANTRANEMPVNADKKRKKKNEPDSRPPKKKAANTSATSEVLLGHVITRCVGIQHYHGNGSRYNREPLQLKRQPNNRFDPKAIGVFTIGGKQVGHVEAKTGDVAAITRVADVLKLKMLGQVESGAGQVYKFPLRVSFLGTPADVPRVIAALGHQLTLIQPKRAAKSIAKGTKSQPTGVAAKSAGAAAKAAAAEKAAIDASFVDPSAQQAAPGDDDEVEFAGERSWEDRNRELLKHAIVLE